MHQLQWGDPPVLRAPSIRAFAQCLKWNNTIIKSTYEDFNKKTMMNTVESRRLSGSKATWVNISSLSREKAIERDGRTKNRKAQTGNRNRGNKTSYDSWRRINRNPSRRPKSESQRPPTNKRTVTEERDRSTDAAKSEPLLDPSPKQGNGSDPF